MSDFEVCPSGTISKLQETKIHEMKASRNQLYTSGNHFQQDYRRVLCVCSAGLLRSPTAALVLAQEYKYNTRSCGIEPSYALIPVSEVLLYWADEIVCMTGHQEEELKLLMKLFEIRETPVICLHIPDDFLYMDPDLVEMIKNNYSVQKATS